MRHPSKHAVLTLQDVVFHLKATSSPKRSDLLMTVDLLKGYFKRPLHEITIDAMRKRHMYFPLYLSFLRLPEEEIAFWGELASDLIALAKDLERARAAK